MKEIFNGNEMRYKPPGLRFKEKEPRKGRVCTFLRHAPIAICLSEGSSGTDEGVSCGTPTRNALNPRARSET